MSTTEPRSVLLSVGEVAARLNVSKATIYRMVRSHELPTIRIGGRTGTVRFDPDAIDQWLRAHATGGAA